MPAACVSLAPAYRIETSKSEGTPSSCEGDVESWDGVAKGLESVASERGDIASGTTISIIDW